MRIFLAFALVAILSALGCNLEKIPDNTSDTDYQLAALNWDASQPGIIEETYPVAVQLSAPNDPNAPLVNIEIQFKITLGNGTVSGATTVKVFTDSQGQASVNWKLGNKLFTEQSVEATIVPSGGSAGAVTFSLTPSYFKDTRDGNVYSTVVFNGDIWMAENLKYNAIGECYGGLPVNCSEYGRLYSWAEATGLPDGSFPGLPHQGICPNGWRLAEQADFEVVEQLVAANSIYMFMCCPELWNSSFHNDGFITNSTGLSFKPGGQKFGNSFFGLEQICIFLTPSPGSSSGYITYHMRVDDGILHFVVTESQYNSKHSCRCIQVE